ncbi:BTAD domain-containing putative transcriptional regulator [Deinococcus aerophilus]|uniref:Bacterial transcriptional activator domain-containing protein n=1 Tax=Deinococcus aerophilus TaxID=522488 RepID=A0ABQ2GXA6_9DEIO|nr:BTAD domain-containing putative transcriptional regulator [Deinococcus aerophilus]GGM16138.1 hypothetical protein GCM10010841_25680 [Deinococcus aerophilus]
MTSSLIPRPARFEITRPTLLTRLAESLDAQVIVLAAPSGYGKSTLLAQYARSTPRPAVWCRLTEAHAGPLEVTRLIARGIQPYVGVHADLLQPDPRTPDHALMDGLIQALAAADTNIDLIVDPVEDDQVARWLISLALALEEGHRVLISRYRAEGLRLARPVAHGQALILDAADLQFSALETANLLDLRGVSLSARVLEEVQGWPAGLALAAAGTQRHVGTQDLVRDSLDGLPDEVRCGLADLAVLETWSEDDACRLGSALPDGWLTRVQRAGLPLLPLGQQHFQPHQLLLGVLEQELTRDPGRRKRLQLAAADMAEGRGELRRAARLYAHAGAVPEFLRVVGPLTDQFRARGEHRLSRDLLDLVPVAQLPDSLAARLAWALIETGDAPRGEALLQGLRRAAQLSPSGFASLAMVYGRRGDVEQQYRYASEGLARLGPGQVEPALSWPFVHAALKRGQHSAAQEAAETMMVWARVQGDPVRLAEAWQLRALVTRHAQDVPSSRQALRESRTIYDGLGWTVRAAMIQLDEAELSLHAGDLAAAQAALGSAPPGMDPGHHLYHVRRLLLDASLALWNGQLERAVDALAGAQTHAQAGQLRLQQQELLLKRADVLITQNRMEEARQLLDGVHPDPLHLQAYHRVLTGLLPGATFVGDVQTVRAWTDAGLRVRGLALLARQHPELMDEARSMALWAQLPEHERRESIARPRPSPEPSPAPGLLLEIAALGDVSVRLAGQAVPVALAKSRELLVWLGQRGSGARDELVTALWDGSAEERHVEYFRVAVRRLRGALRTALSTDFDPLPYQDGRYRLSTALRVHLDARPDLPLPTDLPTLRAQFQAYQQTFLPGVESDWVQEVREHCQQRAIALGLHLAGRSGPDAPEVYQQVLHFEPWCEVAHRGLIQTLVGLERRTEGEQALRTYTRVLRQELGSAPDPGFLQDLARQGLRLP